MKLLEYWYVPLLVLWLVVEAVKRLRYKVPVVLGCLFVYSALVLLWYSMCYLKVGDGIIHHIAFLIGVLLLAGIPLLLGFMEKWDK